MPAVWVCAVGWMCCEELSSQSPHRKQIHRHITGKRALHASLRKEHGFKEEEKRKERKRKKDMHMQPLDTIWGLAGCSLFKIIARCSQSTMGSGREMGGRDFRSKQQSYMGQVYTSATWRTKKKKKRDAKQEGRAADIDQHVCINLHLNQTGSDLQSLNCV